MMNNGSLPNYEDEIILSSSNNSNTSSSLKLDELDYYYCEMEEDNRKRKQIDQQEQEDDDHDYFVLRDETKLSETGPASIRARPKLSKSEQKKAILAHEAIYFNTISGALKKEEETNEEDESILFCQKNIDFGITVLHLPREEEHCTLISLSLVSKQNIDGENRHLPLFPSGYIENQLLPNCKVVELSLDLSGHHMCHLPEFKHLETLKVNFRHSSLLTEKDVDEAILYETSEFFFTGCNHNGTILSKYPTVKHLEITFDFHLKSKAIWFLNEAVLPFQDCFGDFHQLETLRVKCSGYSFILASVGPILVDRNYKEISVENVPSQITICSDKIISQKVQIGVLDILIVSEICNVSDLEISHRLKLRIPEDMFLLEEYTVDKISLNFVTKISFLKNAEIQLLVQLKGDYGEVDPKIHNLLHQLYDKLIQEFNQEKKTAPKISQTLKWS